MTRLEGAIFRANASFEEIYQLALESNLASGSPVFLEKVSAALRDIGAVADGIATGFQASDGQFSSKSSHHDGYERPTPPPSEQSSSDDGHVTATGTMRSIQSPPRSAAAVDVPTIVSTNVRGVPSVLGYEMVPLEFGHVDLPTVYPQEAQPEQHPTYGPVSSYPPNALAFSSGAMAPMFISSELPLPQTFSYHETTLSRFFTRASLEYACRLLHQPDSRPEEVQRVFRYAFRHSTPMVIAQRLVKRLQSSATGDLRSPFQYPQTNGEDDPDARHLGPWFGPDDLEIYLKTKGLRIDPSARTLQCETETIDLDEMPSSMEAWTRHTTSSLDEPFHVEQPGMETHMKDARSQAASWISNFHVDRRDAIALYERPYAQMHNVMFAQPRSKKLRNRVTIDVQKFMKGMFSQTVLAAALLPFKHVGSFESRLHALSS